MIVADAMTRMARNPGPAEVATVLRALKRDCAILANDSSIRSNQVSDRVSATALASAQRDYAALLNTPLKGMTASGRLGSIERTAPSAPSKCALDVTVPPSNSHSDTTS